MVNFPTSLDNDSTLYLVVDAVTDVRDFHHNALKDAVIAIETLLGITGAHAFSFWDAANPAITRYWCMGGRALLGLTQIDGSHSWTYDEGNQWLQSVVIADNFIGVNLPHGAVVTAMRVVCQKTSSASGRVMLYRLANSSGAEDLMASCNFTTSLVVVNDVSPSDATIDNDTYSYFLEVQHYIAADEVRLRSVQIDYTVTKPQP